MYRFRQNHGETKKKIKTTASFWRHTVVWGGVISCNRPKIRKHYVFRALRVQLRCLFRQRGELLYGQGLWTALFVYAAGCQSSKDLLLLQRSSARRRALARQRIDKGLSPLGEGLFY